MIFLTYNDHPSGVFSSQVIDVCAFIREEFKQHVQLVCIFPNKEIQNVTEKILREDKNAVILPAKFPLSFPGLNAWALKKEFRKWKGEPVIARGVFACDLALRMKKAGVFSKLAYDGRGAVKAEFEEYIAPGTWLASVAGKLERNSVLRSDFRIAVTQKLVEYWRSEFGYKSDAHVVIPTTLSTRLRNEMTSEEERKEVRGGLGFGTAEIVLVFSGGRADWQSYDLLKQFVAANFGQKNNLKLLMLVPEFPKGDWPFRDRIVQKWVSPSEVNRYLSACDYGILLREKNITNKVSSPTKFAEYLHAGLKIVISPEVGDSTEMVEKNDLGMVWDPTKGEMIFKNNAERGNHEMNFAHYNFTKLSRKKEYTRLLNFLS
jgi:hypothetical protein